MNLLDFGVYYDTLWFGNLYFNTEFLYKTWTSKNFKNPEKYFNLFNIVNDQISELPECLYPLFYVDGKSVPVSVMSEFFMHRINHENLSIDTIIQEVKSDWFRVYALERFSEILKQTRDEEFNIMLPLRIKDLILNIFIEYENTVDLLVNMIKEVYVFVKQLHIDKQRYINFKLNYIKQDDIIKHYVKFWKLSKEEILSSDVGLSLFNKYISYYIIVNNKRIVIWGISNYEHFQNQYSNTIDFENIFNKLILPTDYFILKEIYKKGDMTISEVSKKCSYSYSYAFKRISILHEQNLIETKSADKNRITYQLNMSCLSKLTTSLTTVFYKILNERKWSERNESNRKKV